MIRKEFIELVQIHFKWLEHYGYEFSSVESSVDYIKATGEIRLSISFHWSEYNDILISGVAALKGFETIEGIISELSGADRDFTIIKSWNKTNNIEDLKTIDIGNNADVERFSKSVNEFYQNEAIPFFDKFESPQSLSNWLETNTSLDPLIPNRNTQMLRKLVIFKESDTDMFQDLYKRYDSFLQTKYLNKISPYDSMYEVFLKFKPYFDTLTDGMNRKQ